VADRWIQPAREEMERKGTVGKFGKATRSKIARGKHSRSLTKRREAIFAQNMKRIAAKRKHHRSGGR
jgi:uncharacterized protein YaiI (UPF0178 family)